MAKKIKTPTSVEEPWTVYSHGYGEAWNFGKVVKREGYKEKISHIWITNFEREGYSFEENLSDCESPSPEQVKTFDNPLKMLAYFLVHQRKFNIIYNKGSLIKSFLLRFPSERNNLETLLAPSLPKCTDSVEVRGEGPTRFIPSEQIPSIRRIDAMEPGYSEPND